MTTPIPDREPSERSGSNTPSRNARRSRYLQAKRPLPATRAEANDLFGPRPGIADTYATGPRLVRLAQLGLLEIRPARGPQITNAEAHEAILDALYPEG